MMNSRNIIRVDFYCLDVILFTVRKVPNFIIAESSVVEGFKMSWVQIDCLCVILNSWMILSQFSESKASVVIEICLIWLNVDGY